MEDFATACVHRETKEPVDENFELLATESAAKKPCIVVVVVVVVMQMVWDATKSTGTKDE